MIRTQIKQDLIDAMKRRDTLVTSVLRMTEAAFANEVIAQGHPLDRSQEIAILKRLVSQRLEAASYFDRGHKPQAADQERAEIKILESYLPAELTDAALRTELETLMTELTIQTPRDFGRLMGQATKRLGDKASGQRIAEMARTLLNGS